MSPDETPYLLILSGPRIGDVIALAATKTIGSDELADLHIPDLSRTHARIVVSPVALFLADLQGDKATRVNGQAVTGPVALRDGDQISLGHQTTLLLFTFHRGLQEELSKGAYDRGARHRITGAYTRRFFVGRLLSEVSYARRHDRPLAVLLLRKDPQTASDPDSEDTVVRAMARRLEPALRSHDVLAQYNEDTFAVLAPETDAHQAYLLAQRLMRLTSTIPFRTSPEAIQLSTTIAIATFSVALHGDPQTFMVAAERALHEAVARGPGQIVVADEDAREG